MKVCSTRNFNSDSSLQIFFQSSGNTSYETRVIGHYPRIETMSIVQSQAGSMIVDLHCMRFLISSVSIVSC